MDNGHESGSSNAVRDEELLTRTHPSRSLRSRLVLTSEVPRPPVPPRDELLPVPPSKVDHLGRCHLPPDMTDLKLVMDWISMPITPFRYFVAPEITSSLELFPRFMVSLPRFIKSSFASAIPLANFIRDAMIEDLFQLHQKKRERQFEETLVQELKGYGFLTYAESLRQWDMLFDLEVEWGNYRSDEPGHHENYDHVNYEVESDQEYMEEQMSDSDYAGEEYFVYPD